MASFHYAVAALLTVLSVVPSPALSRDYSAATKQIQESRLKVEGAVAGWPRGTPFPQELQAAAEQRVDGVTKIWAFCLADASDRFAKSDATADIVADAAFGECTALEVETHHALRLFAISLGHPGDHDIVAERLRSLRDSVRQMTIARILKARG